MAAAILVEQHRPLVVDEVELPRGLDAGQVLVRVACSGICGAQLGEIGGVKGPDPYLPHLLGHEGGAVVVAVGPGVRYVKPGEHVVMHWRPGRGIDAAPPVYGWRGKPLNAGCVTTFNEYAVVSENRLTPVPKGLPLEVAALFGCAVTTGLGVVVNDAKVKIGESVVVLGAGGVGLNIIQGAAMAGAHPIVAVDLYDEKLALAKRFGATHTINGKGADDTSLAGTIQTALGEPTADVAIDNTGDTRMIELACTLTAAAGRTVLVGVPRAGDDIRLHTLPLHFGKVLTGSHGGAAAPHTDIPRYLKLHDAGKLQLKALITNRYPLEKINDAIEDMRSGRAAGRCVIAMDGGE